MPSDALRAFRNWVSNIMHSDLAYLITEKGLLAVVKDRRPDLHPYVQANFRTVWNWIRDTFF